MTETTSTRQLPNVIPMPTVKIKATNPISALTDISRNTMGPMGTPRLTSDSPRSPCNNPAR